VLAVVLDHPTAPQRAHDLDHLVEATPPVAEGLTQLLELLPHPPRPDTEGDAVAGVAYEIKPGHDAWVVGDEPFVAYEFDSSTAQSYATS